MTSSTHLKRLLAGISTFGVIITSALTLAHAEPGPTVTVSVTGFETTEGFIVAALYDEAGWGNDPVDAVRQEVGTGDVIITLAAPTPGRYGVRLFHDVDGDGELKTNMVGIPTEPFGFSNDAPIRFGPPSFAAAAFDVGSEGAAQTISLK